MTEPLLSANKARVVLAALKGTKKLDAETLARLVKKEGLYKHEDPFGSGRWVFLESELVRWFHERLEATKSAPARGSRPSSNRTPENRQALGGSLTER